MLAQEANQNLRTIAIRTCSTRTGQERILNIVHRFHETEPVEYLRGFAHNYDMRMVVHFFYDFIADSVNTGFALIFFSQPQHFTSGSFFAVLVEHVQIAIVRKFLSASCTNNLLLLHSELVCFCNFLLHYPRKLQYHSNLQYDEKLK